MPVKRVLAALAVADVDSALGWYESLVGRPADELSMDGLAEWQCPQTVVIQVVADPERAGRSLLTLGVDDLRQELAALRERGVQAPLDDKVLFATVTGPEGNAITLVEQRQATARSAAARPLSRSRWTATPATTSATPSTSCGDGT